MRFLLCLFICLGVSGQTLNPGRSFYVGGILKPAAGGGGGASCPADGSPDLDQNNQNNAQHCGQNDDYFYVGVKGSLAATTQICKVRFYFGVNAGSVIGKFYTCRIYTMSGTSLNTVVATSDTISGAAFSATAVYFNFASNPSLTSGTTYAIVCYVSDSGGATGTADGSNAINIQFQETTNPQANWSYIAWAKDLSENFAFGNNSDGRWSLYYYD